MDNSVQKDRGYSQWGIGSPVVFTSGPQAQGRESMAKQLGSQCQFLGGFVAILENEQSYTANRKHCLRAVSISDEATLTNRAGAF